MSLHYFNLCQNPNRYTINELMAYKKSKNQSDYDFNRFNHKKCPSQMNLVSPFFDRGKCATKVPCKCPYHKKMQIKHMSLIRKKKQNSNTKQTENCKNKSTKKTQTQPNQGVVTHSHHRNMRSYEKQKTMNPVVATQKQSYFDISHKVQCRNSQFEEFLKKNELYILTGKFPINITRLKQGGNIFEDLQFMQSLRKYFQMNKDEFIKNFQNWKISNSTNKLFSNNLFNRDLSRKIATKVNFNSKSQAENEVIKKVKKLMQNLMSGDEIMNLIKMKKVRLIFSNLLKQQRQTCGQTPENTQNQLFLQKFDKFIGQYQKKENQANNLIKGHERTLKKNGTIKPIYKRNELQQKNNKKIKNANYMQDPNKKQVKLNLGNQKQGINIVINQKNKHFGQIYPNYQSALLQQKDAILIQQFDTKQLSEKQTKKCQFTKNTYKNIKNNKKMFSQHKTMFDYLSIREAQNIKKQKQMQKNQRAAGHQQQRLQNFQKSKLANAKQVKLNQIINNIKSQQIVDNNYLRMKRYIERNKKFIKRMEKKLAYFDLGIFVIDPTDSLITRKKKIRCLKEIMEKNQSERERRMGFYDQIMRYLDIYREHCNMVMKKDIKKKLNQQIDYNYQGVEWQQILKQKDFTGSLKFINLVQNQQNEREKKLQGWISIPKYITNDESRSKFKKIQTQFKPLIFKQRLKTQIIEQSSDSLIQIQPGQRLQMDKQQSFSFSTSIKQIQRNNSSNGKEKCKKPQSVKFDNKIDQFRRRLHLDRL